MAHSEALSVKLILWTLFVQAVAGSQNSSLKALKFHRSPLTQRSLYEQYTLGQVENGAKIIYTYQSTQTFDEEQPEISLDFYYPDSIAENDIDVMEVVAGSSIISQIQLYVKAEDGASTQAYVTEGGIGATNVSLQITAYNTNLLSYMLVIYGTAA